MAYTPLGHHRGEHGQEGADPGVRAGVLARSPTAAPRAPLPVPPTLNGILSPAVIHRDQVLAPGFGPADRSADGAGQLGHQDVLGVQALSAEAAAHVGRDHA